jgi:hypothetical protein
MNGKCSLGAMNGNIQFIGLVMLACIVIIVAIYYFRDVNNKHSKILEKYEESKKAQINNTKYGTTHNAGATSTDLPKFSNKPIISRACQIYFANEDVCDQDTMEHSTCKYVFEDGWKEIEKINESDNNGNPSDMNSYTKKIYNQNYDNDEEIINFKDMGGCFKKVNNETDNRFLYQNNNLVNYGYGGRGNKISLNVDGQQGDYITMHFNNTDVPLTNYNNAIDSICSLKRDSIVSLRNITTNSVNPFFYKFGFDKNNKVNVLRIAKFVNIGSVRPSQGNEMANTELSTALAKKTKFTIDELISFKLSPPSEYDYILSKGNYYRIGIDNVLDITLVELNLEQNAFISHGIADFVQSSAIGIEYKDSSSGKINFNVFKQTSLPDMSVEIYQFKYNYLCDDNVLEYSNQIHTQISLNSFIVASNAENGKKSWSINSNPQIGENFWNKYKASVPREDKKLEIVRDLGKELISQLTQINDTSPAANTIKTLTDKKSSWQLLKTAAETSKSNFHSTDFTSLMSITKPEFTDVDAVVSNNSSIKPFNYQVGYYMLKENPEGPYNPGSTYGTTPYVQTKPLNQTVFSYNLVKEFAFGLPGLIGTKKTNGYYGGDRNRIKDGGVITRSADTNLKAVTNFYGINRDNMGDGGGELYSWYWEGYFVAHEAGNYRFYTNSDDDSFVWFIDDKTLAETLVVNNGGLHPMVYRESSDIYFNAGEYRKIQITFSENYGGDNMIFGWYNRTIYNSWNYTASWNGKTYFYQTVTKNTKTPKLNTPTWTFNNGAYYTEIYSDNEKIALDSLKLNNKDVAQISSTGNQGPDVWVPVSYKNSVDNEPYDFFIQGKSTVNRLYLKAVDKQATLQKKTLDVLSGGRGGDLSFTNTSADESNWWNRSVGNNSSVVVEKYILTRITITSFIYLQKGFYKFNTTMNFPSTLQIQNSIIKVTGIVKDSDNYHRIDTGKFYMMTYSCYALNNTNTSITPVFSLTADFKSLDNSVIKTGENMSPYIYGGTKLYTDYKQSGFMDMFANIKVFQPNTSADFNNIKAFLTLPDRGSDFWNLTFIDEKINGINTQLSSQNTLLAAAKKTVENSYNTTISSIDSLDYDTEFTKNTTYFNNPEIIYKTNISITDIFDKMGTQGVISSYITYEKIKDKVGRTAVNRTDNFNIVNTANKSIYLLKNTISVV